MRVRNSSKFSVEPNNIPQLPPDVSELALVPKDFGYLKEGFLALYSEEYPPEGRRELIFPLEMTGN